MTNHTFVDHIIARNKNGMGTQERNERQQNTRKDSILGKKNQQQCMYEQIEKQNFFLSNMLSFLFVFVIYRATTAVKLCVSSVSLLLLLFSFSPVCTVFYQHLVRTMTTIVCGTNVFRALCFVFFHISSLIFSPLKNRFRFLCLTHFWRIIIFSQNDYAYINSFSSNIRLR